MTFKIQLRNQFFLSEKSDHIILAKYWIDSFYSEVSHE